jgi:DNA (cytosine-5)-methyltransferase 1
MKFLDLFSEIGGFRSGMEKAGHTCVGYVEIDKFARQSYEAMYRTKGLFSKNDIRTVRASEVPKADIWCFGFPCQDISVAGKQKGFAGARSSLFFATTRLIRDLKEKDKPSYLLIENVKNLLSINGGFDFLKLQIELDEIGYDCEWDVLDTAEVLPQHRERVYIVGHFRGRGTRKIFPIQGESTKATQPKVRQIGNISNSQSFNGNPQVGRVYDIWGISPTLNTMQGGGREPKIAIPVLTPERINKRQNGRRFKENGEPEFTLTAQDRHGVLLSGMCIRKLTPLECWRLQGFTDEQFYRAKNAGVSDSQLYKQTGNSVSVPVVYQIVRRLKHE